MATGALRRTFHLHQDLVEDFRNLGLCPGMTVISHCSLSAIGTLVGGLRVYVEAVLEVLGEEGTLVMPAHSEELGDPIYWKNPPVPDSDFARIREQMLAFEPDKTPTWGIGLIAEYFRTYPGVKRSYHPKDSFCAIGQRADYILKDHSLDFGLGESSPLAKIYELGGFILLAGARMNGNTSLHLAEHMANYAAKKVLTEGSPLIRNGRKEWVSYQEVESDSERFCVCEEGLANGSIAYRSGFVGNAKSYLIEQRSCVDYFARLLKSNQAFSKLESPGSTRCSVIE